MVRKEDEEPYAEVQLGVRNLTDSTLYVRDISFARIGVPLEIAQGHDDDPYGGFGKPKDFRGKTLENVRWMVVRPAGTVPSRFSSGDSLWHTVRLRFHGPLPDHVVADLAYSYGSPSSRKRRVRTNEQPLDGG